MFSAEWLALREPADAEARSGRLARLLASALPSDRVLRVVDLGAGTGANTRMLADHLSPRQRWILVDRDAALLEEVPERMQSWAAARGYESRDAASGLSIRGSSFECRLTTRRMDLRVAADEAALWQDSDLVTASALLDLVSGAWLEALAARCAQRGACVLFVLTYDGRIACTPAEPEDEEVRELVNRHQRTDKAFGAALGPDAAAAARACFARAGYDVDCDTSDWVLDSRSSELQRQLIDGWAHAALDLATHAAPIERWRARRLAHVEAGRSRLVVGHTDLVGWPEKTDAAKARNAR